MKLCRYWAVAEAHATDAKGKHLRLRKWGASNESHAAAQQEAERAVAELKARVDGRGFGREDDYAYSLRDVPEELIRALGDGSGITRNAKGCLVLNTQKAFFADVDVKEPGGIAKLFGASREKEEGRYLALLKNFLAQRPEAGARVYRTKAGLRYLFTHAPLPVNDETLGWLKDLGSDKLYVRLCKNQDCYRARLSPKPWRIGLGPIQGHYPYEDPAHRQAFESWLRVYEDKSRPFGVCRLLAAEGESRVHHALEDIVAEHDCMTRAQEDLPLA